MEGRGLIVYKAYNMMQGKVYIGVTRNSIKQRKLDHQERAERGQNGKLYEAIRTYGPEAFIWRTIDTAQSINELAKKEKYWIQQYNSKVDGYNSDEGGGFKKTVYQYDIESRQLINEYPDLNSAASACSASKQDISRAALSVNNEFAGYL
ncbi:GIY-YIG nuclease family protein [Nonlabens sp. YIK11]|uniref:GIY-YIG nuclease family protein n=1 Tax=Nonlabens sp. YIK11 TaxID=1453349 RepID=UPI0009EAFBB6|nr:GIY-YIG nuclease family protein [Nonlabens sp. YIK11]